MRIFNKTLAIIIALVAFGATAFAQDLMSSEAPQKNKAKLDLGLDLMSSYIWRGSSFGTGPAVQPSIEFTVEGFALGAWGNVCAGSDQAFELDPYVSYTFPFGLKLAVTDYYFGGNFLGDNFDNLANAHSLEPAISYQYEGLKLFAAVMFLGKDAEGERQQDFYGEVSYAFEQVYVGIGGGNGQYLRNPKYGTEPDGVFALCNIFVGAEREIKITEHFSLPINGSISLNPYTERLYASVGISL